MPDQKWAVVIGVRRCLPRHRLVPALSRPFCCEKLEIEIAKWIIAVVRPEEEAFVFTI